MHHNNHYAVVEVEIKNMIIKIYNRLNRLLLDYEDHIIHTFKKCMLAEREATATNVTVTINMHDIGILGHSRQATAQVSRYTLNINSHKWQVDSGHFICQTDRFNCRFIVCLKIMELYHQISIEDVQLAYAINSICRLVTDKWNHMVLTCNYVLQISVAEKLGDGSMEIYFYCANSPSMEIIKTPCCKKCVHCHCILHNTMTINSQCLFVRKGSTIKTLLITHQSQDHHLPPVHGSIHWLMMSLIWKC